MDSFALSIHSDETADDDNLCGGCGFDRDDCACLWQDEDAGADNSDHYGGWDNYDEYPF